MFLLYRFSCIKVCNTDQSFILCSLNFEDTIDLQISYAALFRKLYTPFTFEIVLEIFWKLIFGVVLPAVIIGEGKSLIPKPGQTGLLSHGRQTCLMATTQTMVWMDDALRPWMANHLVDVTQTMIPPTRRYRTDRGEWPLRCEVTNSRTW